jgi:hypothetical protein
MRISKIGHIFWNIIKKTHPTINQSNYTIIIDKDKGSLLAMKETVPLLGRFLCSFHHQQNIMKKMQWWKWSKTAVRSVVVQSPHWLQVSCITFCKKEKKYEDKMFPTDRHYLFNIAKEMQFSAVRCAQGNSFWMYGKSASSGVEEMNRANEDIR